MTHPVTRLACGPLSLVARHPALVDVAAALRTGLTPPGAPPLTWRGQDGAAPITVHVGVRDLFGVLPPRRGLSIGIQTEQFYDHGGRPLWGRESRLRLLKYLTVYDWVLDLSDANRAHYNVLPERLRARVLFGPWIFPRRPVAYAAGSDPRPVFFGTPNARRTAAMAGVTPAPLLVPAHTYGDRLSDAIGRHSAVLNIHYGDGVYAEVPRLLIAHLAGKAVMSEPLGPPFVAGVDHLALGPVPDEATLRAAFDGFGHTVAARYRFVDLLAQIGACAADHPEG